MKKVEFHSHLNFLAIKLKKEIKSQKLRRRLKKLRTITFRKGVNRKRKLKMTLMSDARTSKQRNK